MELDYLVYINPNKDPMITLNDDVVFRRQRHRTSIRHRQLPKMTWIMLRNASITGTNTVTGERFYIDQRPAMLAAARRQGILVSNWPILKNGRKP